MNFSSRGFFKFCHRGIQTIVLSETLSGKLGWPRSCGRKPDADVP